MAKNYSITFKSLRAGTVYTLNIGGGTGAAIPLKGGEQPFTTQDDDSDDQFKPIRTQTGYIRIVDDARDIKGNLIDSTLSNPNDWWKDLIPATDLSRPVTLTAGGTVVWQGFMQSQNFSGTLYGNPQEREFPVQCPIAALSASNVNNINRELKNFAYLVKQAFDNLTGITFSSFVFQGGSTAQAFLLKMIDWQNLVTINEDGVQSKYDNQRAIQDMCLFWGWTCRAYKQSIIFSCTDDTTMTGVLTLTSTELTTMAGGTSAGSTSGTFLSDVTLSGDIFASTNQEESLVRGYNKAMVDADVNQADGMVMEAFPGEVEDDMTSSGGNREFYDNNMAAWVSNDKTSFTTNTLVGECVSGSASFNMIKFQQRTGDASIFQDMGTYPVIRINKSYDGSALASLETVFHHSYYDNTTVNGGFDYGGIFILGDVYIKGERYEDANSYGIGQKSIKIKIGIGIDRPSANWTTLTCRVGGKTQSKYLGSISTNNTNMFGKIFIDILGSEDLPLANGQRRFDLVNFGVKFQRRSYEYGLQSSSRMSSREYKAGNNSMDQSQWDADIIYASDNDMEWGYGLVLDPDGKQMGKQTYGTSVLYPEQHLANRVAAYWATSKRKISTELLTNVISEITPRSVVTIDSQTFYPISISRNWCDDTTQITLLKQ